MSVQLINDMTEFEEAIKDPKLVVIDFYADWCGPCKMIGPKVVTMSSEYTDVKFYKVNVDDASDVAEHCEISAMPTFKFFKDGKKIDEDLKGANEQKLRELVSKYR